MSAIHTNVGIVFDSTSTTEGVLLKFDGGNPESINFRIGTGKTIIAENNLFVSGSEHHITASGNISSSLTSTASFGSLQLANLPTSPTGLPTGSVWVSGSRNDASTSDVNCGTLMIVI